MSSYLVIIVKLGMMTSGSSGACMNESGLHEMKLIITSGNLSSIDESVSFGYPMRILQSTSLF